MRIAVVLVLVLAAACSKSEAPPSQQGQGQAQAATRPVSSGKKDPAAAKQLIASGAPVIDVRTPGEFGDGHVGSAINIPVDEVGKRLAEIEKMVGGDKAKPVVVYCRSGRRSAMAQETLQAAGYTQVVNGGGYDDLQ